jgi:hypothetical protein
MPGTAEEIEQYHADALRHVIAEVNRQVDALEAELRAKHERDEAEQHAHDQAVRDAARRISFD